MNNILDINTDLNDVQDLVDSGRTWLRETGPKILTTALIVTVGLVALYLVLKLLNRFLKKIDLDPSLRAFLNNVVKVTFGIVIVISALSSLGIPTTSIIAVFSAAAVAIGLAMKDSLGNVAGGILLLFSKPFRTGDAVEVKGLTGTVTKIDLIYTTFNTFDNKQFIIPNGQLINETIINFSREEKRRLDLVFPVSYKTDIAKAREILLRVVGENEKTLDTPEPIIGVNKYGENAIHIALYVWCSSKDHFALMLQLNERVKAAFEAEGIEIPTIGLRIKSVE